MTRRLGLLGALWVAVATGLGLSTTAAAQVYVSNVDGDTVSVIDPATNAVVTTIAVGSEPRNLAANPAGTRIYVPNRFGDSVSVIDTATNAVVTTVTDASFDEPYGVAVTPDGTEAWVINKEGGGSSTGSVTIIGTATNTVVDTIDDACFSSPEGIAMNPVTAFAYVINRGNGTVCIVNRTTRAVTATVAVGGEPRYAVVTPTGGAVYVSRGTGDAVIRINTSDNSTSSIVTGGTPRNMAITPAGDKVFVATQNGSVARILTATDAVATIALAGASSTYGVAIVNGRAFVTDESNEQVHVVDTTTDTEITGAGLPITDPDFDRPRAIAAAAVAVVAAVPTLSEWALIVVAAVLGLSGLAALRRGGGGLSPA